MMLTGKGFFSFVLYVYGQRRVNSAIPKAVSERCAVAVGAVLKHPYQWQTGPTEGQRSTRSRPRRSVDMINRTPFVGHSISITQNRASGFTAKSRAWGSLESS